MAETTSCNFEIREKMSGKHIQLLFGVGRDMSKEKVLS